MRIPLTKYGWPQVAFYPAITFLIMLLVICIHPGLTALIVIELILGLVLAWLLSFFRDPARKVPQDKNALISPADGTITDIDYLEETSFIKGRAVRIGIFLSIFNVHINRVPCAVKIEKITYKKGEFRDARLAVSSKINESNDIGMTRLDEPQDKLLVRQISGAIARHIVCQTEEGKTLSAGEQFGMIKFGSRTELYLPARDNTKIKVKIGDKVKAGLTILVMYE
jgi:phosphatidylserine decarboxylase